MCSAAPQAPPGQRAGERWGPGHLQREAKLQYEAYHTLQPLPGSAGKLPVLSSDWDALWCAVRGAEAVWRSQPDKQGDGQLEQTHLMLM